MTPPHDFLRAFVAAWSRWGLNRYVCTDPRTAENLRVLRRGVGLDEHDAPSESWEVDRLYVAMANATSDLLLALTLPGDVPAGVGDSGKEPFPSDASRTPITMPVRMEVVSFKNPDGYGYATEVHGYTTDVTTGLLTRIRTRGWEDEVTLESAHALLMTWFDHELREQLGMNPHGQGVKK